MPNNYNEPESPTFEPFYAGFRTPATFDQMLFEDWLNEIRNAFPLEKQLANRIQALSLEEEKLKTLFAQMD